MTTVAVLFVALAVAVTGAAPPSDAYYSHWMGSLFPVISNLTLLDLSLPGTHDTFTYNLSTTVADNANDLPDALAHILHEYHAELNWLEIGHFMRNQSRSQGLSITEQLNAGIRFVDFRTIFTAPPDRSGVNQSEYDWYGLHFVQTFARSMTFFHEIKTWVVAHPSEVVVLWISKHGNNCGTHYTDVPLWAMQRYWKEIRLLFGPLLFNNTQSKHLNETRLVDMMARGQRVVVYLTDFANFTGGEGTDVAYTDCLVDNEFTTDVTNSSFTVFHGINTFRNAQAHINEATKPKNQFYLLSMAGSSTKQIVDASLLRYFSVLLNVTKEDIACASLFHIPNMTEWCPMHLQSMSMLANYYNQIPLAQVLRCPDSPDPFACDMSLPNAIYIDAVDVNGTIRTGTTLFAPEYSDSWSNKGANGRGLSSYGYVDTFAMVNLRRGCAKADGAAMREWCASMEKSIAARWSLHPLQRWDDPFHGRHAVWPV